MENKFDPADIVRQAWSITKKNALVLIGFIVTAILISMFFSIIAEAFKNSAPWLFFLIQVVNTVAQVFISLAIIKLVLSVIDGREVTFSDLLPSMLHVLKYVIALMAIVSIALIIFLAIYLLFTLVNPDFFNVKLNWYLLIFFVGVPVLVVVLRLQFFSYFIIDKNSNAIQSILQSVVITREKVWKLILLILMIIGINILGLLMIGIGLAFTIPMSMVITALAYRKLQEVANQEMLNLLDK